MSHLLRRYFETHRGQGSPLPALAEYVEAHGRPDAPALDELARKVSLPPAALRGALSYYADLGAPAAAARPCRGTSCMLAGAGRPGARRERDGGAAPAYCLGFCDRSPALLLPGGGVLLGRQALGWRAEAAAPAEVPEPPPPDLRCRAREPIVTRNLLAGGAATLAEARAAGVYRALEKGLAAGPEAVLEAVERSGERGRGGAGFPTGRKWRSCREAPGAEKWVVANGDEGDPGSFIDRVLMEGDPHSLLEGLLLCGLAVGARRGIVFIRSEYPRAIARVGAAIGEAREAGILGPKVLGGGFSFDAAVFPGRGSYVCGEETALLSAIEGGRGEVRLRPPYPSESGLWGRPTVVQNVETLVNVPWIVERGPEAYRGLGTPSSAGTKALCLNQGFARPGIVEVEFGVSLREVIEGEAGGGAGGGALAAVLLGGPMGNVLTPGEWEVPVCYGAMAERGIQLGHGGLVALPETTDWAGLLVHLLEFLREESCGKCVPCREGSRLACELALRRDGAGSIDPASRPALLRLFEVMRAASLCAFGQCTPGPLATLVERFGERIFGAAGAAPGGVP